MSKLGLTQTKHREVLRVFPTSREDAEGMGEKGFDAIEIR